LKWRAVTNNYDLYILLMPAIIYFAIFHYWPMYGLQIAFKDFMPSLGILNSPWVGIKHFQSFFDSYHFWQLLQNTIGISIMQLVFGFPVPILLALMINEVTSLTFKKSVQTITYAPHFISVVVIVSMLMIFLSPGTGLVNKVITGLGGEAIPFLADASWFKPIFVISGLWQNAGWGTIIYIAALSSIDPQQHEAAVIDGATRMQRIWHINIPGILPTVVILLILDVGTLMAVGFEKVYLMQNPLNMKSSEIIATYVYKRGVLDAQYSFSTAVGLFNSLINFILLVSVNQLAKRTKQSSLW
jgi:putative aldouronate transport system permease protein